MTPKQRRSRNPEDLLFDDPLSNRLGNAFVEHAHDAASHCPHDGKAFEPLIRAARDSALSVYKYRPVKIRSSECEADGEEEGCGGVM